MLDIKKAENFPDRTYSSSTQERQQIIDALKSGDPCVISGVESEDYSSLQQRIRNAGAKLGVRVGITYQKETKELYFKKKDD